MPVRTPQNGFTMNSMPFTVSAAEAAGFALAPPTIVPDSDRWLPPPWNRHPQVRRQSPRHAAHRAFTRLAAKAGRFTNANGGYTQEIGDNKVSALGVDYCARVDFMC